MKASETNQDPAAATAGDSGQHEMADLDSAKPVSAIEEDLMALARLGELRAIQKLFDSGKYNANSADEQGITALHWAAINGHFALCHFLLQSGADPNMRGGDALATPVLWASKKCQLAVVSLLLQHGADPLIADDAGYNLLHCATLDGNVFQLILLLHQPGIPIDVPDSQGHTSLMWAAYKGFAACVDILLRWGASVNAKDDMGFTALHWALVKGNYACIQKLVEYGADRTVENNEGKTPSVTAKEMNSLRQWHQALQANGFDHSGNPRGFAVPFVEDKRKFYWRFWYLLPFFTLYLGLWIMSSNPIFIGLPGTLIVGYAIQFMAMQSLKWAPSSINTIQKTPYFAGLFSASLFWVGAVAATRVLPYTYTSHPVISAAFVAGYITCAYCYFTTLLTDPGFISRSDSRSETKAVIDALVSTNEFNERSFCSACVIRKPLRSKHCRRCDRCVAREDHHCPWAANCVGVNNHRPFVIYMISLTASIILFIRLYLLHLPLLPSPPTQTCTILSPALCAEYTKAPFTALVVLWSALQLTWVTMLLLVQLAQVARGMTTYEAMRGHHRHAPVVAAIATSSTDTTLPTSGAGPTNLPAPRKKEGWWATSKRLLGLDTVVATALYGSRAEERMRQSRLNPYNGGMVRNCGDFWAGAAGAKARLKGREVDYSRLYSLEGGMRYGAEEYEAVGGEEV